ncbi:hypothetical protein RJ639_027008, partial [Escallonia herrerae]
MALTLKNELMVNSCKTLDGRGAKVAIANEPCQQSNMALLEAVHSMLPTGMALVARPSLFMHLQTFGFTIAVLLFALMDSLTSPIPLLLRSPATTSHSTTKVRYGYAYVANYKYDLWENYVIGGSSEPAILSEGNYFNASDKHGEMLVLFIVLQVKHVEFLAKASERQKSHTLTSNLMWDWPKYPGSNGLTLLVDKYNSIIVKLDLTPITKATLHGGTHNDT